MRRARQRSLRRACRTTDSIIQSSLREAVQGAGAAMERVMLVIAHRVDTITDCDQLLVLADGRLVERGRPRDLAHGSGPFAQLVRAARANEQSGAGDLAL
jgi:ABC-type multidrug transport system fused ATPase/permease subunit